MRADAVQQLRDVHGPDRVLELLPGLFRLPIPLPRNPLRELNAYLIRGRERSLLIDTGFREPACRQALQAGLRAAGAEHDPLDVLLTHIHTDHTGLASEVVRPGGAIYIGRGDYPFTSRAWEEKYWGRIDQRFLQEGFPPEELRITTGTNPAPGSGPGPAQLPAPGGRGQAHRGGIYPGGHRCPRPYPGSDLPVDGKPAGPLHRGPCSL